MSKTYTITFRSFVSFTVGEEEGVQNEDQAWALACALEHSEDVPEQAEQLFAAEIADASWDLLEVGED